MKYRILYLVDKNSEKNLYGKRVLAIWITIGNLLYAQVSGEAGIRSDYVHSDNPDSIVSKLYSKVQYQTEFEDFNVNFLARGYYGLESPEFHRGWVDELTLKKDYGSYSLLIGKHQVNWGESDYFQVINIINPIDLRDYFLSYIEDYKSANKSLWMAQGQFIADDWSTTLLLIPDSEQTGIPHQATGFSNNDISGYESLDAQTPKDFRLKDSSAALQINRTVGETDVGVYGYYGWNPTAIVTSALEKKNFRRKMLGASLTRAVNNFIVRAEAALYLDEAMQLRGYGGKIGDVLKTLFGLDWSSGNTSSSFQVMNTYIYGVSDKELMGKKSTYEGSAYLEQSMNNNNITLSNLLLNNFDSKVGMNEVRMKYRYTEFLNIYIGYDIFWGDKGMLSGYEDQSRWFLNLKYFF